MLIGLVNAAGFYVTDFESELMAGLRFKFELRQREMQLTFPAVVSLVRRQLSTGQKYLRLRPEFMNRQLVFINFTTGHVASSGDIRKLKRTTRTETG